MSSLGALLARAARHRRRWRLVSIPTVGVGILASIVAWLGLQASTFVGETLLGFNKSPISGIMMAILLGLLVSNVIALPPAFKAGITFSLKRVLRLGIILLGIRLAWGTCCGWARWACR